MASNAKATHKSAEFKKMVLSYPLKKQPIIAVGRRRIAGNELYGAKGLAIYEPNQLIYIVNSGHCSIQIVTFEGNFVTSFGQEVLKKPWGIAVTEDNIFITDNHFMTLFQFSDIKIARTGTRGSGEGELISPTGLCVDYNRDVYVADSRNDRVCIFSEDLTFINCLGTQQLKYPVDVNVTPNSIVVLDCNSNCIHFYSRSGYLINSCVSQGVYGIVYNPWFFCLDPVGNILISNLLCNNIKILFPSGGLIHIIGRGGHGRGELSQPRGIGISQLGIIFIVSINDNFHLQSF
ncbi:NHL repeat protein [Oopsacas minuta]|uniref:NHL repeat protein n=1 Tax=Oopsacas minuta TaxID=111878 RepID=A0AAV7JC30_9METZ|nr:NHL repeat protein [Oopsacas minuta]